MENEKQTTVLEADIHEICLVINNALGKGEVTQEKIDALAETLESPEIKEVNPDQYLEWRKGEEQEQVEQEIFQLVVEGLSKIKYSKSFTTRTEKTKIEAENDLVARKLYQDIMASECGLYALKKSVYRPVMGKIAGMFSFLESQLELDTDISLLKHLQLEADKEDLSAIPVSALTAFMEKTQKAYEEKYPPKQKESREAGEIDTTDVSK